MDTNKRQRRNIRSKGFSGLMNGITSNFIPINSFRTTKRATKRKQKRKTKVKAAETTEQCGWNNITRREIENMSTFFESSPYEDLRPELELIPQQEQVLPAFNEEGPITLTDLVAVINESQGISDLKGNKKKKPVKPSIYISNKQGSTFTVTFPASKGGSWIYEKHVYVDKNPFGNCQVLAIGQVISLFEAKKEDRLEVLNKCFCSSNKRQAVIDIKLNKEGLKLIEETIVPNFEIMWRQDYINGTGSNMANMMIKQEKEFKDVFEDELC